MNLNTIETAEALKNISFVTDPTIVCNYAATMLRQQQAEISVSENLVKHLHSENKQLRNENEELQDEIEVLKEKIKWLEGKELLRNE